MAAELSDERRALLDWIALEFLHNSWAGRRLLAVEGATDGPAARFADDLAELLRERGQTVVRRSLGDVDEETLRRETVEPFRAGTLPGAEGEAGAETVLVVDGRRLLNDAVRGIWHFTAWTLVGDELPKTGVNVNVDVTDEAAPKRYFYDYCAIPPSFGERRASTPTPQASPATPDGR
ncbi:nucleoside/nucleotide kinase family protein [Agromyces humi]|uniref:hypothetical protein n=1 Tax=Agromyces humi TaxID=1766800 RepID=UPI00135ABAF3|nr:hypothetical protein [Agromyces humi]